MKKGYTLTLRFASGEIYEDLPVMAEGFSLTERVGEDGHHAQQSCSCLINEPSLWKKIVYETENFFADLYKGTELFFQGVVKPYAEMQLQHDHLEPLSIEILDYTEILKKYVYDPAFAGDRELLFSRTWEDKSCYEILNDLFDAVGLAALSVERVLPISLKASTIRHFSIKSGDTVDKVINTLLYELCCDYRFSPGKVEVFPITREEGASLTEISEFNNDFKVEKKDQPKDGVSVKFQEYHQKRYLLYTNSVNKTVYHPFQPAYIFYDVHYDGKRLLDGPPSGSGQNISWDLSNFKADTAGQKIQNVRITSYDIYPRITVTEQGKTRSIPHTVYFSDENEKGARFYCSTPEGRYLREAYWHGELEIYGKIMWDDNSVSTEYAHGTNPENVTLKYVDSPVLAHEFAEKVHLLQNQTVIVYQFKTFTRLSPGMFYSLREDSLSGILHTVRIISASYDALSNLWTYEAHGADQIQLVPVVSIPGIEQEEAIPVNPLVLETERTLFLTEETDSEIRIRATGYAAERGSISSWSFNGSIVSGTDPFLSVYKSELSEGNNNVSCTAVVDGIEYKAELKISLQSTSNKTIIQYRWSESNTEPPFGGGIWVWSKKPIISSGRALGDFEGKMWTEATPSKEPGKPYLWIRISTDGGKTWNYSCISGPPSKSFSLRCEQSSFDISRAVLTHAQTLTFRVSRSNVSGPVLWTVQTAPDQISDIGGEGGDERLIVLPKHARISKVAVAASIPSEPSLPAQTCVISGTDTAPLGGQYLGVMEQSVFESFRTLEFIPDDFPIAPVRGMLISPGDHVVVNVVEASGKAGPVPYSFISKELGWAAVDSSTQNYSEIMGHVLGDVLEMPDTRLTEAAQYGYFGNLAANIAFIRNLFASNLKVGEGDRESGFSFRIEGMDQDGNLLEYPILECYYQGANMFSVNFQSKQVIIGDFFGSGGLLWDAITKQMTINGTGNFKGQLDTVTIKTLMGGDTIIPLGNMSNPSEFWGKVSSWTPDEWRVLIGDMSNGKKVAKIIAKSEVHEDRFYSREKRSYGYYIDTCESVWSCESIVQDTEGTIYLYRTRKSLQDAHYHTGGAEKHYEPRPTYDEFWGIPVYRSRYRNDTDHEWGGSTQQPYIASDTEPASMLAKGLSALFPAGITNLGYRDSTKERLFIENLPSAAPSEPNRVYRNGQYLCIT